MKRPYLQNERAATQARTRQKIVDATMQLHQDKGLLATTVSDIAKRAGVGKVTVYRHFPSDTELVEACSGQYFHLNPFPDLESWSSIASARIRIMKALKDTYEFHNKTEPMMSGILSEARNHPVVQPYHDFWAQAVEVLASDLPPAFSNDKTFKARLSLALSFDTWYILTKKQRLSENQALVIMLDLLNLSKEYTAPKID